MPCRDGGPSPEEVNRSVKAEQRRNKAINNKIDTLTRMLCTLCKLSNEKGMSLPTEISKWYEEHKEVDKKRLADALKSALAKLNDDEKEALGLL